MMPSRVLATVGDFGFFSAGTFRSIALGRFSWRSLIRQMERVGIESLAVVNLCAFFIGMVLVIQIAAMLGRFGAQTEVSAIIGVSFVREIGPVFAAIMYAGRIGTGITAELGSMVVTEQVDALRVMGADPTERLVVPRVLASVLMVPALTAVADLVGIFSGYIATWYSIDLRPYEYLQKAIGQLTRLDLVSSMVKATFFGLTISLVATYMGMRVERSTESVGAATTRTMVAGVLGILVVDFLITKVFLGLSGK